MTNTGLLRILASHYRKAEDLSLIHGEKPKRSSSAVHCPEQVAIACKGLSVEQLFLCVSHVVYVPVSCIYRNSLPIIWLRCKRLLQTEDGLPISGASAVVTSNRTHTTLLRTVVRLICSGCRQPMVLRQCTLSAALRAFRWSQTLSAACYSMAAEHQLF